MHTGRNCVAHPFEPRFPWLSSFPRGGILWQYENQAQKISAKQSQLRMEKEKQSPEDFIWASPLVMPVSSMNRRILFSPNLVWVRFWSPTMRGFWQRLKGLFSSYYSIPPYKIIKENGELACIVYLPCARPLGKVLSPVISHLCVCACTQSYPALCNPMDCSPRLLDPWRFPDKNIGAGCHFLLQGIFPNQGSNLGLSHLLH